MAETSCRIIGIASRVASVALAAQNARRAGDFRRVPQRHHSYGAVWAMTTNPDQRLHAWLAGSAMRAASDAGLGLVLLCAGAAAILAASGMILRSGFALGPGFFPTV